MRLAQALLDRAHEVLAEPLEDEIRDALDLAERIEVRRLGSADLEQGAIPEDLEGRAIDVARAKIAQEVELAEDRELRRLEASRALDPEVAELVEFTVGPAPPAEGLELVHRPVEAFRLLELLFKSLRELDQVEHVRCGIAELLFGQGSAGPVRALLVLG